MEIEGKKEEAKCGVGDRFWYITTTPQNAH